MPDTQYFTNIDGKYVKDAEARQQLNDLEDYVESLDQPWQPLEDGYSNFWFELTNDTLSPWLNFSAKTDDAVIDWGDGSGEQALTTLTPTHTYAKAGRYVVKVKGVTGIARQYNIRIDTNPLTIYTNALKNVELNSEVETIETSGFVFATGLENIVAESPISISAYTFQYCANLKSVNLSLTDSSSIGLSFQQCLSLRDVKLGNSLEAVGVSAFNYCVSLSEITIPSTVTSIGNTAFSNCSSLSRIYIKATTPPTLGNNVFSGTYANYIIYVPVGYGDTYKAASGWSTYADHILEEGQQPNRAMLAKFNSAKTDEPQDDMR